MKYFLIRANYDDHPSEIIGGFANWDSKAVDFVVTAHANNHHITSIYKDEYRYKGAEHGALEFHESTLLFSR